MRTCVDFQTDNMAANIPKEMKAIQVSDSPPLLNHKPNIHIISSHLISSHIISYNIT